MIEDVLKFIMLGLGGWALRALHLVQLDLRTLRVIMVGEQGDNGINSRVKAQGRTIELIGERLAHHDTQIAILRGGE